LGLGAALGDSGADVLTKRLAFAFGVEQAPAAYLVAVKRLSIFLSVLLGGLWLQERPLLPRVAGVVLMCSGVACIALRG
jgi:drug/metabolite transporter (DMT)-like permease